MSRVITGKTERTDVRRDDSEATRTIINTIIGAIQGWVTSKRKRDDHLRAVKNLNLALTSTSKPIPSFTIHFSDIYAYMVPDDGYNPIVITTHVINFDVKRILIDNGSTVKILSFNAFQTIELKETDLKPTKPIYGFSNQCIKVLGQVL